MPAAAGFFAHALFDAAVVHDRAEDAGHHLQAGHLAQVGVLAGDAEDVAQLNVDTTAKLNLTTKLTAILSDSDWVAMTQNTHANGAKFDKVVTIAL